MSEFTGGRELKPEPFERFKTTLTLTDEAAERIKAVVEDNQDVVQKMEAYVKAGRELAAVASWADVDPSRVEKDLPKNDIYDIMVEDYPYETGHFSPGHSDLGDEMVRPVAINIKTGKVLLMGYGQMDEKYGETISGFLLIADPSLRVQDVEAFLFRADEGKILEIDFDKEFITEALKSEY